MTESAKQSLEELCCVGCQYNAPYKSQYERHLLTAKHNRMTNGFIKGQKKYECKLCNFITTHSNKYVDHLETTKHIRMTDAHKPRQTEVISENPGLDTVAQQYTSIDKKNICECGKEYKFRQGLHKHKKICSFKNEPQANNDSAFLENVFTPSNIMEFITNIVKTNENMKQLMIEQMKHHMETEKKLIELIKEPINKDK
jgi:hypothetical protein